MDGFVSVGFDICIALGYIGRYPITTTLKKSFQDCASFVAGDINVGITVHESYLTEWK